MAETVNTIKEIFFDGAKLANLRVRRGKTKRQVANEIGISPQSYGEMESGECKPSADTLARICIVLDTPISELCNIPENFL